LRDLIGKGFKPTAIRYLLASVPFRKPLNFTFDGLHQAQQSIERLRNFRYRLTKEKFPAGENPAVQARASEARQAFESGLDDNLNTAEALAAVFDLVRDGNTAMDRGEFRDGDRGAFLDTLERWDRTFAVLEDTDHAKLVEYGFLKPSTVALPDSLAGTREEAVAAKAGNGFPGAGAAESLAEEVIEKQIAERDAARRRGDYARSDQIRENLLKAGVILEDTKAGTRWKRK
jgi:cysteinyl-tRNA synthetase